MLILLKNRNSTAYVLTIFSANWQCRGAASKAPLGTCRGEPAEPSRCTEGCSPVGGVFCRWPGEDFTVSAGDRTARGKSVPRAFVWSPTSWGLSTWEVSHGAVSWGRGRRPPGGAVDIINVSDANGDGEQGRGHPVEDAQ